MLPLSEVGHPWNFDRHDNLGLATAHATVIKAASRLRPELAAHVDQLLDAAGLREYVDGVLAEDQTYRGWDEAAWQGHSEQELHGPPLVTPHRSV